MYRMCSIRALLNRVPLPIPLAKTRSSIASTMQFPLTTFRMAPNDASRHLHLMAHKQSSRPSSDALNVGKYIFFY